MENLSDKEVKLINKYPNLYQQVNSFLNFAYWFFAISIAGWVLGGLYFLIQLGAR